MIDIGNGSSFEAWATVLVIVCGVNMAVIVFLWCLGSVIDKSRRKREELHKLYEAIGKVPADKWEHLRGGAYRQ